LAPDTPEREIGAAVRELIHGFFSSLPVQSVEDSSHLPRMTNIALGSTSAAGMRSTSSQGRLIVALVFAMSLGGCSWGAGESPLAVPFEGLGGIEYSTRIEGAPSGATQALLEATLRLYTLSERAPASLARLKRRAESDLQTAERVLKSEGFYDATATLALDPSASPAIVQLSLRPGTRYTLAEASFALDLPADVELPAPSHFALKAGQPARAAEIVAAERGAVRWLRDRGFAQARFASRDAVSDPATKTLAVASRIDAGPRTRFGKLAIIGLETVDETYVQTYRPWSEGEWYSQRAVDRFTELLSGTGLFEYARVAATPDALTRLEVKEAPHRGVGGGLRFSTEDGPAGRAYLEHRNLLGGNETARISATAALFEQELRATFTKPQFLRAEQTLLAGAAIRQQDDDAFNEVAFRTSVNIERVANARLRYSVGLSVEAADISGSNRDGKSLLVGLPLAATYDASDALLDPSSGYRLRAGLTTYAGTFDGAKVAFPVVDVHGAAYWPLGEHVLAIRSRIGSIIGIERDDVPPPQRLYSGGGGSVRGYESRAIGPLDGQLEPLGGRCVVELGFEVRLRLSRQFGLVPFVGAGAVDASSIPRFSDGIQYSAGLGFRYFSAVGPIRADVGFPLNPREDDDVFQWYVSIGQAF
jgi:translocation and assembly module TamA